MRCIKMLFVVMMMVMFSTSAYAETVATGSLDGYYNNGMFTTFKNKLERTSRGEIEVERVSEDGTEGSVDNLGRVNSGDADFAFVQKGATVLKDYPNVKVIGTIGYEIAHLVYPNGSKVDSCGDLDSKKAYRVGVGYLSGSKVTSEVMTKVDKTYGRASWTDTIDGVDAIMKFQASELDAFFFVSMPNSGAIKRFTESYPEYKFGNCWDGDFDEFEINGKPLYRKVKVGKKNGYPNTFKSFAVPTVLVANTAWLKENRKFLPAVMDATKMTFDSIKATKKLTYYPKR